MSFLSSSNQQDPILKILPLMSIFTGFSNLLLVSIQCPRVWGQLNIEPPLSKSAALQGNQKIPPTDPLECKLPKRKGFCPVPHWFKYLAWSNINICLMNEWLNNWVWTWPGKSPAEDWRICLSTTTENLLVRSSFSGEIIIVVTSGFP